MSAASDASGASAASSPSPAPSPPSGTPSVAARLDRLPLSGWHRRLIVIVGLGAFFDLYEVFLGGVLGAVLTDAWSLSGTQKSMVIAAAFLGMFAGANILSVAADRLGRRRMFLVNLALYSFFSLAAAFAPNLGVLLALRFLAGLGLGAELVLVDTYLAEFLPRRVRGRYISWAYTVGFVGVPIAALLGARLVASRELLGLAGWRWLLIFGAVGAFVIWAARSRLPESPRWLVSRGRGAEAAQVVAGIEERVTAGSAAALPPVPDEEPAPPVRRNVPLSEMFGPAYRRRTVMLWIFQVLQTVAYYGFGSLAPVVLVAKGYEVTESLTFAALSFLGYPIGSALAVPLIDRIERKLLIIGSAAGIGVFGIVFAAARLPWLIVTAGFLLTVCSNVFSNAFHTYQTEVFPTGMRSSAVGIAYSLSRLTSAVLPFVAVRVLDSAGATAVFTGSAVLIVLLCLDIALLGPRTTGRGLEAVAERPEGDPGAGTAAGKPTETTT
ncbi:MFS transporter [Streptomyces sp. TS71-3]|uniref:MFS transporter n=1 Tax=Streptomyces sp. TS71-3 TaxID=2733862 RepID=UPI001BB318EB|nr:MFS transporter [Streptomyces sp. TS71-3]